MLRFMHCPRCGQSVSISLDSGHATAQCEFCQEAFQIQSGAPFRLPDELELEGDANSSARSPWADVSRSSASGAHTFNISSLVPPGVDVTPAAVPVAPKDPDKALTSFALGIFRVRSWPCRELEGYRAFVVRVGFRKPLGGEKDICNITVSAVGGVLTFETILHPLPPPPWMPIREALNSINSVSRAVFVLRECGVVARHKLLPRGTENGSFTVDGIFNTLRQLNHDRLMAKPLLEAVLRGEALDCMALERNFGFPPPSQAGVTLTLAQACDLAGFAGFFRTLEGPTLYLSHAPCAVEECKVCVGVMGGALRGWTVLEEGQEKRWPGQRWALVRQILRNTTRMGPAISRSLLTRVLERLNALNDCSGMLRYVWNNGAVLALAVHTPAEMDIRVEEFKFFADALFRCACEGERELKAIRRAV